MFTFLFIYTIVLLPHHSVSQTFLPFGSYEYYIEKNNPVSSYSEAERKCNASLAALAVVNTKDIRDFLVSKIGNLTAPPYSFYIGLKRINNERYGFEWNDGSPLTYSNWYQGEPNHVATGISAWNYEGCVAMGWRYSNERGLQWSDVVCNKWRSLYICQRAILTTTTMKSTTIRTTVTTPPARLMQTTITNGLSTKSIKPKEATATTQLTSTATITCSPYFLPRKQVMEKSKIHCIICKIS